MNENGEISLADIIKIWLKDTYPDFEIVRDTFSVLHIMTPIKTHNWLALSIYLSIGFTSRLALTAERVDDNSVIYNHAFKIYGDKIEDILDKLKTNYAYNSNFLNKLKKEIDEIISGDWFDHLEIKQ